MSNRRDGRRDGKTAGKTARDGAHGVRRFRKNTIRPFARRLVIARVAVDALEIIDREAARRGISRGEAVSRIVRTVEAERVAGKEVAA